MKKANKILITTLPIFLISAIPLSFIIKNSIIYIPKNYIGYNYYNSKVYNSGYHLKYLFTDVKKICINNYYHISFEINEDIYKLIIFYKYNNKIGCKKLTDDLYTHYLESKIKKLISFKYNDDYFKSNTYKRISNDELLKLLNEYFNEEGFIITKIEEQYDKNGKFYGYPQINNL